MTTRTLETPATARETLDTGTWLDTFPIDEIDHHPDGSWTVKVGSFTGNGLTLDAAGTQALVLAGLLKKPKDPPSVRHDRLQVGPPPAPAPVFYGGRHHRH